MSTVDVPTLKARAEELIARAIAGEPTVIEQDGKKVVLLACEGVVPDFALDPDLDSLLKSRGLASGREASSEDWERLRQSIRKE